MNADTPEKSFTASASEKNKEKLKKVFNQVSSETPENTSPDREDVAHEETSNDQVEATETSTAKDVPEDILTPEAFLDLKRELSVLQERFDQEQEKFVREKAEFANRLKRKDLEKDKALKFAQEKFFKDFLLVLDSVDGALMQNQDQLTVEQLIEGLEMMSQQMGSTLKTFGLEVVNPEVGTLFSPQTCEAMSMQPTSEHEHNTIIAVIQKGYLYQERLLRPARVIVAQKAD